MDGRFTPQIYKKNAKDSQWGKRYCFISGISADTGIQYPGILCAERTDAYNKKAATHHKR